MRQAYDRQAQGRDTGEGTSATAVVDPGRETRVAQTTDELLTDTNLLLRAMVLGLSLLTDVDLLKEVQG